MAHKIFIASASETKEKYAQPIAQALSEVDFEVKRWWKVFQPGDFTLERLVQLSNEVQGAVFVCTGTEQTWYHGEKTDQARDNVIFELGLFLNRLEPGLAVVIKDADTKLPSDLSGLTYLNAGQDPTTIAEKLVTHFKNQFQKLERSRRSSGPSVIRIEVDPVLSEISLDKSAPNGWHQRALYLGTEGARGWLAVAKDRGYLAPRDRDRIRHNILEVLKGIPVSTFISLGPGDAEMDREVAISLSAKTPRLIYIPVDISEGLLFHAAHMLAARADVPVGILSDFEEGLPFIIERLATRAESPLLIGLLGYTLGNLDRYEETFLRQLESWLVTGDHVLMEVLIAGEHFDINKQSMPDHPAACRFLANGISWQSNKPIEEILKEFSRSIGRRVGRSDAPGAKSYVFFNEALNTIVQNERFYEWKSFLKWIEDCFAFEIMAERSFFFEGEDCGDGVVLLRRK